MVRPLAVPLLALCLGLWVLEAFRGNALLSEALLAETRRVAEAGAVLERLGGRRTENPPSPLPLPGGRPARVRGSVSAGYRVIVFQDQAEVRRLAESLTQSRRHLDLLRAQAHEFQNFLHLLGGLLELGRVEEALRLLRREGEAEARLEAVLARVELPLLAALLLGKWRRAQELGVEMDLEGQLPAQYAPLGDLLASVLGQLLENALEAAAQNPGGQVRLRFRAGEEGLSVEVWDNGPGPQGEALFQPEASSRGAGRGYGLALARTLVQAAGGRLGYRRQEGWTVFWVAFGKPWTARSS